VRGRRGLRLLVATLLAGSPAFAWHGEGEEIVQDTAYTLGERTDQLGLWRYDRGVAGWLDVGTSPLLLLIPFPNFQAKLRVWEERRVALAIRSGVYYLDLGFVPWASPDSNASIVIVPFELFWSFPVWRGFGMTLVSSSTATHLWGAYDPSEFEGAGVVDNQQVGLSVDWRLGRVVALVLTARWLAFERARGDATVTRRLDDFTTLRIAGAASVQARSVRDAGYVMLSSVFSWETFNLRVGAGAGNLNVPVVNILLPEPGLVGELDVYWRF